MQIYTATVLNGSAFFNYMKIFTDYYGLMQLGLKILQHCTNLIDNAHRSELLLAAFYFSFPFWASWCYPFGKPVISPEYREGFNKIKHMHATFQHCLKLVTWHIFTLSCKPTDYPCSDLVLNYLNTTTEITHIHTHNGIMHVQIQNTRPLQTLSLIQQEGRGKRCKLNSLPADGSSVIYTYNVGFPLNFFMPLGASSRWRMTAYVAEYVNQYDSIQSSIF